MIRMGTMEERDQVLVEDSHFFYGKPLIVEAWEPEVDWKQKNVKRVAIWIELQGLDFKYWGEKSPGKIVSP